MEKSLVRTLKRNWRGFIGGVLFLFIVAVVAAAPVIAPYDPQEQVLADSLKAPSITPVESGRIYTLGSDQLGRDVLSRLIYGGRVSLTVGVIAVLMAGFIGVVLGLIAGYFGGILDTLIMRLADIQLAVPSILLAIVMVAVLGPSLVNVVLVLAITGWVTYARVVRGNVLTIKEMEYIDAARCLGVGKIRMLFRHILPNTVFSVIIIATLQMARMILLEASLSFLGLGVEISTPTWGNMIGEGRSYITSAWWLCTMPGLAIVVVIIGINMLGDWLRDTLDPKLNF
jgi:ABC-type dipeptide/oligopeptide/nickel transport systems, permease components